MKPEGLTNDELREAIKYARWNLMSVSPGPHWDTWHAHLRALLKIEADRAVGSAGTNSGESRG